MIATQRAASEEHLGELTAARESREDDSAQGLAWSLVVDSMIFTAEAELRWLDHVQTRLAQHPQHALALELTTERPKRGRPARAEVAALV